MTNERARWIEEHTANLWEHDPQLLRDAMAVADRNPVGDMSVARQAVLCWLGFWRDKMPKDAVSQLQEITDSFAGRNPITTVGDSSSSVVATLPHPAMRELLAEALAIANEPDGVDLRVRETRIVNWKRQAQAALALPGPVVEVVMEARHSNNEASGNVIAVYEPAFGSDAFPELHVHRGKWVARDGDTVRVAIWRT